MAKEQALPSVISREMMKRADLIFCTYHFVLDPIIKGQMLLNLNDVILIIDEAHNVESVCREAGNFHTDKTELDWSLMICRVNLKKVEGEDLIACQRIVSLFQPIVKWLHNMIHILKVQQKEHLVIQDNEEAYSLWGVTLEEWPNLEHRLLQLFLAINKNMNNHEKNGILPMRISGLLEYLWAVIGISFRQNKKMMNDFLVVAFASGVIDIYEMNPEEPFELRAGKPKVFF
jgi:Rad3-related DNA helicase